MPLIIFEGPKMEQEKKRQLVRAFAQAASRATGIRMEVFTTVIHENVSENIGVGGELLLDKLSAESGGAARDA